MKSLTIVCLCVLVLGCTDTLRLVSPDASTDAPTDVDSDTDTDTDTEELDASVDASVDAGDGCIGWLDSNTGLCWSNPSLEASGGYNGAVTYCTDNGGRIPDIWELRTLLRVPTVDECSTNLPGGACGVGPDCTSPECADDCGACELINGPGIGGLYQDPALNAVNFLWSATPVATLMDEWWLVYMESGEIVHYPETTPYVGVRCIYDN